MCSKKQLTQINAIIITPIPRLTHVYISVCFESSSCSLKNKILFLIPKDNRMIFGCLKSRLCKLRSCREEALFNKNRRAP